jgi:hypothetical protein
MPVAGIANIDPKDDTLLPPQYDISEIKRRVGRGPVAWRLVFQMAPEGDEIDDLTRLWPESRPQVFAGQLVIDRELLLAGLWGVEIAAQRDAREADGRLLVDPERAAEVKLAVRSDRPGVDWDLERGRDGSERDPGAGHERLEQHVARAEQAASPPVAGCRPAVASARAVWTLQATSSSSVPIAVSVTSAWCGASR